MSLRNLFSAFIFIFCGLLYSNCDSENNPPSDPVVEPSPAWTNLLDNDLNKWDKFIGVPHYSVNLPGYPKGDGMNGTPLGLNNDPLNVFKVETINNEPVLVISGEIYGGLSTKDQFKNYHLKMEFKWGTKKYEPRLTAKRDNGILYHATGQHGFFWNVWMNSQEMQVQEGDIGDYFALGPGADIKAANKLEDNEQEWIYDPAANLEMFGIGSNKGRCRRGKNYEKPNGEWNTLELFCLGTKCLHVVNGKVVMVLENSRKNAGNGQYAPLTEGKIQIQSEGAEAYYKNIQIRGISEIPSEYL